MTPDFLPSLELLPFILLPLFGFINMAAAATPSGGVTCADSPVLNSVTIAHVRIDPCMGDAWTVRGTVSLSKGLPDGFEIMWYFGSDTSPNPSTSPAGANQNLTRDFTVGDIGSTNMGNGTVTMYAKAGASIRIIDGGEVCDGKDESSDVSRNSWRCFA